MSEAQKPLVRLPDPTRVAASLSRIRETARKLVGDALDRQARQAKGEPTPKADGGEIVARSFVELTQRLLASPGKLVELQLAFWKDYWSLWERTSRRVLGAKVEPVIQPSPADRRFHDPEWAESAVFDFIKQSYLLAARSIHGVVASASGLDPKTAERVDFYTRQFVDAMSPTQQRRAQPRRPQGDAGDRRREPRRGARQPARGPRAQQGAARSASAADGRVRRREGPRGDARKGRLPERSRCSSSSTRRRPRRCTRCRCSSSRRGSTNTTSSISRPGTRGCDGPSARASRCSRSPG